jgi:hypothetical protein
LMCRFFFAYHTRTTNITDKFIKFFETLSPKRLPFS